MASNLAISVRADTGEARAQLALVQSDVRSLGRALSQAANEARSADLGGAVTPQLQKLAAEFEAARREAAELAKSLSGEVKGGLAGLNEIVKAPLEGLAQLKSSLRETAEFAGLVFLVEKGKEAIVTMGELGERTVNMAAAVGTTPHEFSLLSSALQLAGGDAETASRTLERLGRNMQEALTVPSSQAAKAVASLGITQAELKHASTDLSFALDLIANKFAEFADSPQKTADFIALLGRGFETLVPILRGGAAGLEEFKQKAQETGIVLSNQDAAALAETGEKVHLLAAAIEGEGVRAFLSIKSAIDGAIDGLITFVKWAGDAVSWAGRALSAVGQIEADMAAGAIGEAPPTGGGAGTVTLPDVTVTAAAKPQVAPWAEKAKGGRGGAKGQASELEAWREELQQRLEAENNFFKDSTTEELAFWQQKLSLTKAGSKEQAEVESTIYGLKKRLAQQGLRADEAALSEQQSLDREYLSAFERNMKLLVATKQISLQQALGFDIQYTRALEDQEKARLQAFLADDRLSADEKRRYYDQLLALEASYDAKVAAFETEAAENAGKAWKDAAKQISDAVATAATDVIERTKSIGQAFDQLVASILKDTVQSTFKGLFNSLLGTGGSGGGSALDLTSLLFGAGGLGGSLFGQGGLSGALGLGSGGLLGSLFGAASGAADQDFSGAVGGAVSSTAGGGGGFLGALFSGIGSLFAFARGGIVPSAAGGWAVPQLGSSGVLAQLHSNEMVLPANISQGLQGMIAGGGASPSVNATFAVSAMDAGSIATFFKNNGATLVAALNQAMKNGSALRGAAA